MPGIIILGTTGEFLTLTDDERTQFVETTVKHIAGRMHVLVGTMNAYTPNAVRYSRRGRGARRRRADDHAALLLHADRGRDRPLLRRDLRQGRSIPIMLYNNPFTSNVDMSAKLVARLTRAFEQIRYIKEASHGRRRGSTTSSRRPRA